MKITLRKYYNDQVVSLDRNDIETMERFTAEDDAKWGHIFDAKPYTAISLKEGKKTSENVGTAYVAETPQEILDLAAA